MSLDEMCTEARYQERLARYKRREDSGKAFVKLLKMPTVIEIQEAARTGHDRFSQSSQCVLRHAGFIDDLNARVKASYPQDIAKQLTFTYEFTHHDIDFRPMCKLDLIWSNKSEQKWKAFKFT